MMKCLSLLLSFSLILTSITPSIAQIYQPTPPPSRLQNVSRYQQNTWERDGVQQAVAVDEYRAQVQRSMYELKFTQVSKEQVPVLEQINHFLRQMEQLAKEADDPAPEEEKPLTLDEFEKQYRAANEPALQEALRKAKTPAEKEAYKKAFDQLIDDTWATAYQAYVTEFGAFKAQQEAQRAQQEKQFIEDLRKLCEKAVTVTPFIATGYRTQPVMPANNNLGGLHGAVDPISVFLPAVYEAFGEKAVTQAVREKASGVLRDRITQLNSGSGSQALLQNAHALALLGTQEKDAFAIADVLRKHFNEPGVAPVFINTLGADLLAMKDVAGYQPIVSLLLTAKNQELDDLSVWDYTPLKLENWVKAVHDLASGGEFATKTYINSFYKDDTPDPSCGNKPCDNHQSAWIDFGRELAAVAEKDPQLKSALDGVMEELVVVRPGKDGAIQLFTHNNLLITGLLAWGFKLNPKGHMPHDAFTQNGVARMPDTRGEVAAAVSQVKAMGLTPSEYVAFVLYHQGYMDINPITARYIRNALTQAIPEHKREALGMHVVLHTTKEEVENYDMWQKVQSNFAFADKVLAFVAEFVVYWVLTDGVLAIAGNAVRFGTSFVRAVRLSTTLSRSAKGTMSAAQLARLAKIAHRVTFGNRATLQVGKTFMVATQASGKVEKVSVTAKNIVKRAQQISGKNIFTHDGMTYFVANGYKNVLVRVNGRVQVEVVRTTMTRAQIAEKFGVAAEDILEVTVKNGKPVGRALEWLNGTKQATQPLGSATQGGLNYTAGAAGVHQGPVSIGAGVGAGVSETIAPVTLQAAPRVAETIPAALPKAATSALTPTATQTALQTGNWLKRGWKWLDETVIHWRPLNSATPGFWRGSWDRLNYLLRIQAPDFFSQVGQLVTTRRGAMAFGTSMTPAFAANGLNAGVQTAIVAEANTARNALVVTEMATDATAAATSAVESSAGAALTQGTSALNSLGKTLFGGMRAAGTGTLALNLSPWWAPENQQQTPSQLRIGKDFQHWWNSRERYLSFRTKALALSPTDQAAAGGITSSQIASAVTTQTTEDESAAATAEESSPSSGTTENQTTLSSKTPQTLSAYIIKQLDVISTPQMAASLLFPIPSSWLETLANARSKDEKRARSVLSQQYPLVSALKAILTGQTTTKHKELALLKLYNLGKLSVVLQALPTSTQEEIERLSIDSDWKKLGEVLYSLYEMGAIKEAVDNLAENTPTATLLDEVGQVVNTPQFRREMEARYNQMEVIPPSQASFQGEVPLPSEADIKKIVNTFRTAEEFTIVDEGEDRGDYIYYAQNIPFYYRNASGVISAQPVGVLSQDKSSMLNRILSSIYIPAKQRGKITWKRKQILAEQQGLSIPKGFVLVLDEQGQWKFMVLPGNRAIVEATPASKKMLDEMQKKGSVRVAVDTPYKTGNLLAMAKMLENNPNLRLQLVLNPPSSFKQFLTVFGTYIGLDSANSLTGPFKKMLSATGPLGWPVSLISTVAGGFGYVSPWIGGWAMAGMTKIGYARTIKWLFGIAGAVMAIAFFWLGMDGWSDFPNMVKAFQQDPSNMDLFGQMAISLSVPLGVAVITGSLFGALVPIILNIYKDPTARTAASLSFATTKQYSRLGLTALTAMLGGVVIGGHEGDWTIMVPVALGLLGISAALFFNTPILKNAKEEAAKKKQDEKEKEEQWIKEGKDPAKMRKAEKKAAKAEKKEFKKEYHQTFRNSPIVKACIERVRGVYWAYAPSLMMIGQIANALLGTSYGQWIAAGFMFVTALIRSWSKKQVENKVRTDDELTGASIPLLAITAALLAFMPYQVAWIAIPTVLVAALHYVGTAVPGQLDMTRLQNMVSSEMAKEKQKVTDDPTLPEDVRKAALKKLERKEKDWASRASSSYQYANGMGEVGVIIAALLGFVLVDQSPMWAQDFLHGISSALGYAGENLTLTMQRITFALSAVVLSYLTVKNTDLTKDFIRGLRSPKITQQNIDDGKINAATFGISAKNVSSNLARVTKDMNQLGEKMVAFGVVSENKMTDMFHSLSVSYNRLLALREVEGMNPVLQKAFDKWFELARTFRLLLGKHKMSVMLEREFMKVARASSQDGLLEVLAGNPFYVAETEYSLPAEYHRFEDAKMLIQELNMLAGKIQAGVDVEINTYRLFVDYYGRVKENLSIYRKANVADSNRVLVMEEEVNAICKALKEADQQNNLLDLHRGPVSPHDVQALRDMLSGVAGD